MPPNNQQETWCRNTMWMVTLIVISGEYFVNGDSSIPHPCDNVKCPALSELSCPADSSIRELIAEPLIATEHEDEFRNNSTTFLRPSEITEEIFAECCLNKKCVCKLCHIPDCHNDGEVVVELQPESIDMPGFCCGKYECQLEPNCTEVQDTENYWLTNCQRCKCYAGQRICHQSCDEGVKKPAMCHSENLNTFYEHGQSWRDGCYDCECINGEADCMITFCKGLNCPKRRQVQLKDSCCPVCWPKGAPMPNADEEYDEDEDYDESIINETNGKHDYTEHEQQVEPDVELRPIIDTMRATNLAFTTTTPIITTTTTSAVKPSIAKESSTTSPNAIIVPSPVTSVSSIPPCKNENNENISKSTTTPEPCNRQEVPATYQVYPQVVELMRYSQHNNLLYTIIACLSVIVVILAAWNIHLKAKQRSYRPVSNFDDNFNRMSSNIKKMNDYV